MGVNRKKKAAHEILTGKIENGVSNGRKKLAERWTKHIETQGDKNNYRSC
jgi:hypothetical protein